MRRRHKAQYAARERAHLAPSVPHVRRDQCLPAANPSPVQPTLLHMKSKQNFQSKAAEMKKRTLSNFHQVSDQSGVGNHLIFDPHLSLDCDSESSDVTQDDIINRTCTGGNSQIL